MHDDFDIDGLFDDSPIILSQDFGRSLLDLRQLPPPPPPVTINWTPEQLHAVEDIVRWRHDPTAPRYFKLTGAAGTGKTTVLQEVRRRLKGTKIAFSAMTGKAAMRLRLLSGAKTKTFHSAIYHPPLEVDNVEEEKIDLDFKHVRNDGDDGALLVVDECFDYRQNIWTEHGWKEIGQVVTNEERIRVWARNPETGMLELKPIIRWLKKENKYGSLLKIKANRNDSNRGGRTIRCTPDHKILTPQGYVKASALKVGDDVVVKGFRFTQEQKSIVVGSIFGDGSISRGPSRNSPQMKFMLGRKQLSYLMFKAKAMGCMASPIKSYPSGYENGDDVFSFTLDVLDEMYDITREMISGAARSNGRRMWSPSDTLLNMIDEQALAIWFLDNGSISSKPQVSGDVSSHATLHTQRFTKQDNERFALYLQSRFGIDSQVREDSYGYWYLRFRKDATDRLFDVIRPFTPACMSWKVASSTDYVAPTVVAQPDTTISKVRSIEEDKYGKNGEVRKYVYDIEVADHHNYVAGNIVVSNCSMTGIKQKRDMDQSSYTKVLLVGDPYQLPPVLSRAEEEECGADYSVFTGTPGPHLDRVMRNAGAVLQAATVVRMERRIPTECMEHGGSRYDYLGLGDPDTVIRTATESFLADRVGHVLITWRNDPRMAATNMIRSRLGKTSPLPEVGEPVVIRKNAHKKGIMNGDSAEVAEVGADGPTIAGVDTKWFTVALASNGHIVEILAPMDFTGTMPYVKLDVWKRALGEAQLKEKKIDDVIPLTFGYVLTCHLAQGDQYRRTTTFLPGDFRSQHFTKPTKLPDGNVMDFSMRFIYTALTRSMERGDLIVSR